MEKSVITEQKCVENIFSFLKLNELLSVRLVSRDFKSVVEVDDRLSSLLKFYAFWHRSNIESKKYSSFLSQRYKETLLAEMRNAIHLTKLQELLEDKIFENYSNLISKCKFTQYTPIDFEGGYFIDWNYKARFLEFDYLVDGQKFTLESWYWDHDPDLFMFKICFWTNDENICKKLKISNMNPDEKIELLSLGRVEYEHNYGSLFILNGVAELMKISMNHLLEFILLVFQGNLTFEICIDMMDDIDDEICIVKKTVKSKLNIHDKAMNFIKSLQSNNTERSPLDFIEDKITNLFAMERSSFFSKTRTRSNPLFNSKFGILMEYIEKIDGEANVVVVEQTLLVPVDLKFKLYFPFTGKKFEIELFGCMQKCDGKVKEFDFSLTINGSMIWTTIDGLKENLFDHFKDVFSTEMQFDSCDDGITFENFLYFTFSLSKFIMCTEFIIPSYTAMWIANPIVVNDIFRECSSFIKLENGTKMEIAY